MPAISRRPIEQQSIGLERNLATRQIARDPQSREDMAEPRELDPTRDVDRFVQQCSGGIVR